MQVINAVIIITAKHSIKLRVQLKKQFSTIFALNPSLRQALRVNKEIVENQPPSRVGAMLIFSFYRFP